MPSKKKLPSAGGWILDPATVLALISRHSEVMRMTPNARYLLAVDTAEAVGFASAGHPVLRKRDKGIGPVRQILAADVMRAMDRRGLNVSSSRRYLDCNGHQRESLFFRLLRDAASLARVQQRAGHVVRLPIGLDPFDLFQSAKSVTFGLP